jgi:hypothetical protein
MSDRDQQIIKAILSFLDKLDGGQAVEVMIHASAQTDLRNRGEAAPSLREFEASLLICDQRGWATGLRSRVTRQMKWSLSDEGKAALLEMG